jgi:dihydrolipoamide dehydrogenase
VAHKAVAEATVAAAALNGRPASFDPLAIPVVLGAGPGIAAVGLTEDAARASGLRAVTARAPLPGHPAASGAAPGAALAHARAPDGFVQLTVDLDRDVVVGAHMAGPHAAGLAGEAALAVEMMASPEDLAATLHPRLSAGAALAAAASCLAREHPPPGR